ncbi:MULTISPECIES: hypothetical protein [Aerococcus]|uniref:Phage resistance protein n=1 Tax=Aerococcus sanguinicola TaxID=119206 RepID=A0A0X8FC49_9LACT|nr:MULTISPECIES: hypothetical protein [Aerococcus]AMB94414.1 hypothetical protein AWM72_06380 [Aerococcus sanguinicola]MDK7051092.1 phage resistance protein [Aerococcus sanguinicola]OFT94084.1 hypothetical protein HMPREF3090_06080 [Aerococcus sp. HMSC23C02]PKZ20737.1 phage resistance protein [Aerococcus sanguinicola]
MEARKLYERLFQIKEKLDRVTTPNLARIKDILNKIYFADIKSPRQSIENIGDVFHMPKGFEYGKYFKSLPLNYIIQAGITGLYYGRITTEKRKDGQENEVAKTSKGFNAYAMFVADLCSEKIIYSHELDSFLLLSEPHSYIQLTDGQFKNHYGVNRNQAIDDFLQVFEDLFKHHFEKEHGYQVMPYVIAGKGWLYDVEALEMKKYQLQEKELVASYFSNVELGDLQTKWAKGYLDFMNDKPECLHNMSLLFAYVMYRKMDIVPAEKIFLIKDQGGTGKGLFMHALKSVYEVVPVDSDSLLYGSSIEKQNVLMRFLDAEVAHLNETGRITSKQWPSLRKIGTGEVLTGRYIGANQISFKSEAVLILDTNEKIEVTDLKANLRRMVNIAPKDRQQESPKETEQAFTPWWQWIAPKGKPNEKAGLSFLVASLDYLKAQGGQFNFKPYTFANVNKASEFTDTQEILLRVIKEQKFIYAKDERLQEAIKADYGSLKYKKAQDDIKDIGVETNKQKWIDGINSKVHVIGDRDLFERMFQVLEG